MNIRNKSYSFLIFLHIIIGLIIFVFPFLAKVYAILVVVIGLKEVIKSKNKSNEVLLVAAYVVGVEVILRMTNGMFINEYAKYNVMLFMIIGIGYSGISKYSFPYWLFLIFLLPGVFYGMYQLNYDTNIRKAIAFNISGPVCLGISALYCFNRDISFTQLKNVLTALGLPILSTVVYVVLYNPSVKDVVIGTYSNFETSGGFGPNQMSTILGLGMFAFFVMTLFNSSNKKILIINTILTCVMAYRCIVTFSRGGMITGILMIVALLFFTMLKLNKPAQGKIMVFIFAALFISLSVWTYSSIQTGGMIDKRYANQDAKGRVKESKLTGRETLIESEFDMFWENPITGVGVGKNKEYREEVTGIEAASHNEISRMLAEQGILGVFCLFILIVTPIFLFVTGGNQNIFLLSFFIFWALTINHAAMRIAAPAFVYALALLNVTFPNEDKNPLHRESTVPARIE